MTAALRHAPYGIAQLPGFAASLRILLDDEQYAMTDVALMFGVSRERLRQLVARYGMAVPLTGRGLKSVRIWDDSAHRFQPVARGVLKRQRARRYSQTYWAARQQVRAGYRAHVEAVLRALAEAAPDRRVGLVDLGVALGGVAWGDEQDEARAASLIKSAWWSTGGSGVMRRLWQACDALPLTGGRKAHMVGAP